MNKCTWFKDAVVYQVYPKSFMDADGDGMGDLRGVISRLDYLRTLGIDVIWLNPCYKNSGVDGGYDISDYRAIAPELGTMADFDELLAQEVAPLVVCVFVARHELDVLIVAEEVDKGRLGVVLVGT